jgi:hypothetical protein
MISGLVALFLLSVVLLAALTGPGAPDTSRGGQGQDVDRIKCEGREQLAYHVHQHLFILVDGNPQPVPAYVGIVGPPLLPTCLYWIHTHDATGLIHVESPVQAIYTLGQFFDIWGQPLNSTKVATHPITGSQMMVFVDGHAFGGDPRDIPLGVHTQIVLEIGRPVAPPEFTFPAGT